MKLNRPFLIQMLVAVALIGSWLIYENQQDDRKEYLDVLSHTRSNKRTIDLIASSSDGLIQSAERMVEKSPNQKPLVDIMKEMQSTIGDYYDFIETTQSDFFEYDLNEIEKSKYEKPVFILPLDYHSTKRIKRVFKGTDTFNDFDKKWSETLIKLKKLHSKSMDIEVLSDSILNDYSKKQALAIQENTTLHQQLIEEKEFCNIILKYDVVHAESLLTALQSELKSLEWILLQNTSRLFHEEKNKFATIIMMSTKGTPQVGKPTHFEFYPAAYVTMDSMEIRLNGKPYEVKNGVATFNYTPQSAGMKYFKVDISLKNPFTGKTDNFSDTKKIEVFE